jgi:GPH family glycoside/pentoside/hexuronide:cation symporter
MLFFFYEAEIGLNSLLVGLGLAIYAVWDAINDPLVGFLTDRPFKFTRKWGRRFPWIVVFFVPMLFSFLLIFYPPNVDPVEGQWILFAWLVFSTCFYDTIESIFIINFYALFPDKFRLSSERLTTAGYMVYIGFVGILFSFTIPPMILVFGDISSYLTMAWICVLIGLLIYVLIIPGVKDDKKSVELFLSSQEKTSRDPFFRSLKGIFRQKSFIAFLLLFLLYQSLTQTMGASTTYYTRFVVIGAPALISLIMFMLFIGALIAVPFWYKISKRTQDYKKIILLAGTIMVVSAALLTFFVDVSFVLVLLIIQGLGVGGFWIMIAPTYSDVIDESIVLHGKRKEGTYSAFRYFMGNIARVIQAFILVITHVLTGFVEGADVQPASAIFGIRLHMGIIPALVMAVGLVIFWKLYDITPEKSKEFKNKIKELDL